MSAPGLRFFTVGHSNRSIAEFLDLLRENEIAYLADVRKLPGSRACPQFDAEPLRAALGELQIGYEHIAALGGRRGRSKEAPSGLNQLWTNRSFHNYADYALTPPFRDGFERLRAMGRTGRVAMMCAEAVWWRRHRRIIADYLIAAGENVIHIMSRGRTEPARLTPGAVARQDGSVIYPAVD